MEQFPETTIEAVSQTLSSHYSRFDAVAHANVVSAIVTLLDDPTKSYVDINSGFESDATYGTRMILLETFRHGASSVKATTELFNSLERGHELGWLAD